MTAPLNERVPQRSIASFGEDSFTDLDRPLVAEPPHPVNWKLLNDDEAEVEWIALPPWVNWSSALRHISSTLTTPIDTARHSFGWHHDVVDALYESTTWQRHRGRDSRVIHSQGRPPAGENSRRCRRRPWSATKTKTSRCSLSMTSPAVEWQVHFPVVLGVLHPRQN